MLKLLSKYENLFEMREKLSTKNKVILKTIYSLVFIDTAKKKKKNTKKYQTYFKTIFKKLFRILFCHYSIHLQRVFTSENNHLKIIVN